MPLTKAPNTPINLTLARDRVQSIKRGHPWIFGNYLEDLPKAAAGSLALLRDRSGSVIAQGFYDPKSHLAFRVLAINPLRFGEEVLFERIRSAFELRRSIVRNGSTNAYRLLNGEGDGLPGLICDLYGDHAVFQLDGDGPRGFWELTEIAKFIHSLGGPANALYKPRSNEDGDVQLLLGELPEDQEILIQEHGKTFAVDWLRGQKTGFFLDQRDNRHRFGTFAVDKKVLNLFGYTGGFSVYAGRAGARHVTTVDSAKPAIEAAKRNWHLNDLPADRHIGLAQDAFQFLAERRIAKEEWDLVVVDPPSFAPSKELREKARAAYLSLLIATIKVTTKGGLLAASSCSSHISPSEFLELCEEAISKASRRATVLGLYGQPHDHPFPLACQELQYLKFFLFRVE